MLLEFNEFVVRCGHNLLNHQPEDSLQGRLDSAVTKTNVHFPTDVNLLWDSMRGLLLELPKACMAHEVKSGRKSKFWSPRERAVFQSVNTSHKWRNMAKVEAYFAVCRQLVARDQVTLAELQALEASTGKIEKYLADAVHQIDLVERRLIKKEVIPHEEKVFSIHEPHTRWISKGKAGLTSAVYNCSELYNMPIFIGLRPISDGYPGRTEHYICGLPSRSWR